MASEARRKKTTCSVLLAGATVYPADRNGTATSAWMLIPFLSVWRGCFVLQTWEGNLIDPSFGRERGDSASCSVVSNPPESHLALFLLTTSPSRPLLLPLLLPPCLTDWRKWTSANWPQWRGESDSKTTLALLSNQLACGLSPSSSVSVSCIKLASESSLFGLIAGYGLGLCVYIGPCKSAY